MEIILNENAHIDAGFLADDDVLFGVILDDSSLCFGDDASDVVDQRIFDDYAFIIEEEDEEDWREFILSLQK